MTINANNQRGVLLLPEAFNRITPQRTLYSTDEFNSSSSSDEEKMREKYNTYRSIVHNLAKSLREINAREHQSGLFRGFLKAVIGPNVNNSQVARALHVTRKAVILARKEKEEKDASFFYQPFVTKPVIIRIRIPTEVTQLTLHLLLFADSNLTANKNSHTLAGRSISTLFQLCQCAPKEDLRPAYNSSPEALAHNHQGSIVSALSDGTPPPIL